MKRMIVVAVIAAVCIMIALSVAPQATGETFAPRGCYYYDAAAGSFVWGPCPTVAPANCYFYDPVVGAFVWGPCPASANG